MATPLAHQRILITRAEADAPALADRLRALGATPLVAPMGAFAEPADWGPVDAAIARIDAFDWLVLTSPQGVRAFASRLAGKPLPAGLALAAVGPKTAEASRAVGWAPALVPARTHGEGLAEAIGAAAAGRRFLLARGDLASAALPDALRRAGGTVTEVVTYVNRPADAGALSEMLAEGLDWAAFASGSAFERLVAALAEPEALRGVKLASIGPKTSAVIRSAGFEVAAEAAASSVEGLVAAIVGYRSSEGFGSP